MSSTKPKIFTLALGALLLSEEVSNTETDQTNNVRVLNTHWETALESTLQDLDLDSLSEPIALELLADLRNDSDYEGPWTYVYKYPTRCAFLRRLVSGFATDNGETHISKRIAVYNDQKAIFTDQSQAIGECITNDLSLDALSSMAALAIAYKLAFLSAPLLVGKGAKSLRKDIQADYAAALIKAQEIDSLENFNYEDDDLRSEFVSARIS